MALLFSLAKENVVCQPSSTRWSIPTEAGARRGPSGPSNVGRELPIGDGSTGRPPGRRRRGQRHRHRARCRRSRAVASCCASRTTSPSHTSSASSKLIHGGLRYLEHYEFRLVREALIEREVLLRAAPHIIWPLRFVLPHSPEQRPAWMIRLGLFLYDHLGGRERLPGSARDRPRATIRPARRSSRSSAPAFAYADCWVDDARLVVLNAMDAAERGAEILTRTPLRRGRARERPLAGDARPRRRRAASASVRARCLVNATGPWVSRFLTEQPRLPALKQVRLVKGSHIVVPRLLRSSRSLHPAEHRPPGRLRHPLRAANSR